MNGKKANALGLISGAFTTFSLVPQAASMWLNAPTPASAVSISMYAVLIVGIVGWFCYGLILRAWPLVLWNGISGGLALLIFVYKWMYG